MKRIFVFLGIALVILLQLNCSSEQEQEKIINPTLSGVADDINAAPLVEEVNLESMYEDEVRKLATKTPVQLITVIEGTSKVIIEAEFRRVQPTGFGFPLYECVLTDEAIQAMGGTAQGMSGSPVGPPGKVFGALSYGDAWAAPPHRFWVTPIDAMEATLEHTTFGEFLNPPGAPSAVVNATYAQVKTPITITGIDNSRLEQLSSHLSGTRFDSVEFYSRIGGAPAATPANASPNLSAGDMIGVATVTGDVVNSIGFGTVTQVYGDKFVAFGHDMFLDGQVSLPVYRAVVDGIVPNTRISYKSSVAYGNPIGTITKDLRPGIVGELGPPPAMIPVNVIYQPVNSPEPIRKRHKVAYGQESFIPIVAATTLDAIRMEVNPGTIEGNVVISFKETDNVYTESFRTITPDPYESVLGYIGSIVEPFTNKLYNGAGRATIDEVNISMIDIPYILHAEITDIHVVGEVKQGEVATFVLEMLPHWTAAGNTRSMYREVKLPIPENFVTGPAVISMAAVTEYGFNPFSSRFPPSPASLNGFIKQLKDAQFDKGLVLVTLATEEEQIPEEASIEDLLEEFFAQFLDTLLENLPVPGDGELPPDNGELPPGDGELPPGDSEIPDDGEMVVEESEMIIEEAMMEEIPSDTPITGTALIVRRFIVTGDTDVEVEVLPVDVELDADAEDTTE